ncbi:MAG: hypothetical protein EA001_14785 [Oscillatoriales cyanobacterium]|nr:MAG: hypothetical protein EA001_14785 [Oscillatoriales cyanobacterium]
MSGEDRNQATDAQRFISDLTRSTDLGLLCCSLGGRILIALGRSRSPKRHQAQKISIELL